MSGNNTVSNFKIKGTNVAGDGESTFINVSDGYLKLYHVQTPSSSNTEWAANVGYVNNAINGIDLSGYATETYVNNAINGIDLSGYATETYANTSVSSYLPLAGGTMTGKLTSNHASNARVDSDRMILHLTRTSNTMAIGRCQFSLIELNYQNN